MNLWWIGSTKEYNLESFPHNSTHFFSNFPFPFHSKCFDTSRFSQWPQTVKQVMNRSKLLLGGVSSASAVGVHTMGFLLRSGKIPLLAFGNVGSVVKQNSSVRSVSTNRTATPIKIIFPVASFCLNKRRILSS